MGDDLNFAQKFTRTAADGLALLAEMDDPRAANEASVVIDMMVTVQRGAKRLRARHIYTGAQGVLSALHHENDATLYGRIENLGSLVTEYARGLEDLLQAPKAANVQTPVDKWEAARATLNDILPTAAPETADILSRLMRAPVTLAAVNPNQALDQAINQGEAEIHPFDQVKRAETPSELPVVAAPVVSPAPTPEWPISAPVIQKTTPLTDEPVIALDAMMRDVIADALSVARSVNRTISLSYDMGDRTISACRAENLRVRLGKALSQIIRQSLSDGRVGHIDVNLAGEQLHIMAGTTAVRVAIDPEDAPAAKPLITPETDAGLRAKLDALLDPASFHETAS